MAALSEFINKNWVIFYFIYGQVFFLTGFAIALKARGGSALPLGRSLGRLAWFGLLQGLAEWGYVFIPIQATYASPELIVFLKSLLVVLIATSFSFLLAFGTALVRFPTGMGSEPAEVARRRRWLALVAPTALVAWSAGALAHAPGVSGSGFDQWVQLGDTWARYLIALPGSALSAVGLFAHARDLDALAYGKATRHLRNAAAWFAAYAFFGGVLVEPASFFPASVFNAVTVFGTRVPVTIIRAVCGMGILYGITRGLELFDVETRRRVELAERSQAVLEERERFGRDLHDSVIQSLYGVGLALENARFLIDENPAAAKNVVGRVMSRLDSTVRDIRAYITGLDPAETQARTLRERLEIVVAEFNATGHGARVELRVDGEPGGVVDPRQVANIAGFATEALSNVAKHAQASSAAVELRFGPQSLSVAVIDDGVGFERDRDGGAHREGHHGLKNMARRAELLGGRFDIETEAGRGTCVRLTLPYSDPESGSDGEGGNAWALTPTERSG